MSKIFNTVFVDELLGVTGDKEALMLIFDQLRESLGYIGFANLKCYGKSKNIETEKATKELVKKLYEDKYVDEDFVKFVDDAFKCKKEVLNTYKKIKFEESTDASSFMVKKAKVILRELNDYIYNYYGRIFVGKED